MKIIFLISALLFVSCNRTKEYDIDTLVELNNPILEKEIISYNKSIKSSMGQQSYLIDVFCKEINDSVQRYVISSVVSIKHLDDFPCHFVCKVRDIPVLFTMMAGRDNWNFKNKPFFRLNKKKRADMERSFFPGKSNDSAFSIYDPANVYLTFCNNRLVGKEVHQGLYRDASKYRINGKEFCD